MIPHESEWIEQEIASWLIEEEEEQAEKAATETVVAEAVVGASAGPAPHASRDSVLQADDAVSLPPSSDSDLPPDEQIRLVRIDSAGALLEFPASRLEETLFRCAMPRRCLRCGAQAHLHAEVIVYHQQMLAGVSLQAEHAAGKLSLSDKEARGLTNEQLLARLPRVPNVPHPADLPMPYWVCDLCTAGSMISGEIHVRSDTGQGRCRLLIANLRRAEEFMIVAGGADSPDHETLHKRVQATTEKPWDRWPQMVQDRLSQWYKPKESEHFLAYVPDRDHVRTEDGVAGIVVTNQRLLYHTRTRHRECLAGESMELQLAMNGRQGHLRIRAQSWQIKHLSVDREGISRLRHSLTVGKFRAVWD